MSQFLVLGQIGDPTVGLPGGAGAELWYLKPTSYGQQVTSIGLVDSLARYDSDDYPILSPAGRTLLRRLFVTIAYKGACAIEVTPRIDFNTLLSAQAFTLPATAVRKTHVLDVVLARACSYVGVRLDVTSRNDRVEFLGLAAAHRPLAQAADYVAGSEA
jgi:hypothetical protein